MVFSPSARRLSKEVPCGLRRAVRLDIAMEHFGAHWSGAITGGLDVREKGNPFELSQSAEHIDDFLSHDWATKGWLKFASLCLIYNGTPALLATYAVTLVVGLLQTDLLPLLPRPFVSYRNVGGQLYKVNIGGCCVFLGPLVYGAVFFFWQRIRRFLPLRARVVFMDKLCVHQTDNVLKQAGILAMAGFLRISTRLVVLWSPCYLSRLWCVYELAAWIHLGRGIANVEFMPVVLAVIAGVLFFGVWGLYVCSTFAMSQAGGRLQLDLALGSLLVAIFIPFVSYMVRRLSEDLRRMRDQVAGFSASSADCYCCCHGHLHPKTQEQLPCDRELVFSTLAEWFGPASSSAGEDGLRESGDEFLAAFDSYVRQQFAQVFGKQWLWHLRYSQMLGAMTPAVGYCCDRLPVFWMLSWQDCLRTAMEYIFMCFALLPLTAQLLFFLINIDQRWLCCRKRSQCAASIQALVTASLSTAWLGISLCLWSALVWSKDLASVVPQLLICLLLGGSAGLVFYRPQRMNGMAGVGTLAEPRSDAEPSL